MNDCLRPQTTRTPAVVVRMDNNPFHHGTLAAIRSLGRLGVDVHAVIAEPYGPAARSNYLSSCHSWLDAPTRAESFLSTLLALADRIGSRPVLLPMDDITAIYMAEHANVLTSGFRLSEPAGTLPEQLANKRTLAAICDEFDIPHPETRVVETPADWLHVERTYDFPVVAKWAQPWKVAFGNGLRSTSVIDSPAELQALKAVAARQDSELLLQEYIAPAPGTDWFLHGYFGGDPSRDFVGTGRKERSHPPAAGITTLGRWLPNPKIARMGRKLVDALHFTGILDLDFRYNPHDGEYYLLDFNPRVGAQFRLFDDTNQVDVIRAAYFDLAGHPCHPGAPSYGRTYVVENYDLLRNLVRGQKPRGPKTPGWFTSVRRADELAWYASDDHEPFFGMIRQSLLHALKQRR
ncbi:ATP-grasp domain-containing protein [Nonomuraea sp. NPDC050663]|uniref:ATP-grasp domain-containing protein n=1 Tax=Nonomuraea sp. NPDC050663 TaxID=3364370 RepID=UPI0037AC2ED8